MYWVVEGEKCEWCDVELSREQILQNEAYCSDGCWESAYRAERNAELRALGCADK